MPPKTEAQEVLAMITRRAFLTGLITTTALVAAPGAVVATMTKEDWQRFAVVTDGLGHEVIGAPTISINGRNARPITTASGKPLKAGDLTPGQVVTIQWA